MSTVSHRSRYMCVPYRGNAARVGRRPRCRDNPVPSRVHRATSSEHPQPPRSAQPPGPGVRVRLRPPSPQVLLFEHLPEARRSPVGCQELVAGAVAVTPIAVVAEQPSDPRTHVDHLLGRHERAQTAGEVRGRADVHHLVHRALHTAAGDRDLVLAGQVGELRGAGQATIHRPEVRGGVDDLVTRDAGEGAADDGAGDVAAGLMGGEITAPSRAQISGTSSMRVQWSWKFWRSVTSQTSRPKRWLMRPPPPPAPR